MTGSAQVKVIVLLGGFDLNLFVPKNCPSALPFTLVVLVGFATGYEPMQKLYKYKFKYKHKIT